MKASLKLYKGCNTPEERKDRQALLQAGLPIFKLLYLLIECDIKEARDKHISEGYSDASWAYKQADLNGTIRAYTSMLELLSINEDLK